MPEIPVIDVADALSGRDVEATAARIDAAMRRFGFFQLTGHGIEPHVFERAYDQMQLLMAQPADVKDAVRNSTGHPYYGLVPKPEPSEKRVVAEQFEINRFETAEAARLAGVSDQHLSHFGSNLWPAGMPDFEPAVRGCFDRSHALLLPLLGLFEVALGLPSGTFAPYMARDSTSFAVSSYPYHDFMATGQEVLEWHTDRETLVNMLHQRGTYEGLQLRHGSEVLTVPIVPDALVVNVGQLIELWSGGRWPAAWHRVVSGAPGQWRQSIVTFSAPDVEMPIVPMLPEDAPADAVAEPFRVYDLAADMPRQVVPA